MLAPVVLFVYNRPVHTKKTIKALVKNELADKSILYIFSDGPKDNPDDIEKVALVRTFIDKLVLKNYFKEVHIIKAEKNNGLANSVINGVTTIINQYGKVIVLEDDLITSRDFLVFMNEALNYYKNKSRIWSVTGFNRIPIPKKYKDDIFLSYRGSCWGWATWKNRWNKIDWNVSDYIYFRNNKKLRKSFDKGGKDLSPMLDLQMQGKIDSWAIRWSYSQYKLNKLQIQPVFSKVKNIGLDGSGTHGTASRKYNKLFKENIKTKLSLPPLNKQITKLVKKHHLSIGKFYLNKLKTLIKKIIKYN
ncbi:MAG: sugar transferase [Candidatus Epulonipiscium fishelsonii]|nr:MAG: sugar transferase [Epulopiscium sp. AS2M-Bin002]